MLTSILLLMLALPHGGEFQPPLDPEQPGAPPAFPTQPGTGPVAVFSAARWEWWFDFNQEGLLRLRERMTTRATPEGERPYLAVTDRLRLRRVLPVLVHALRHRHRDVRSSATMSLGRLGLASAVPYIETMLEDPDLFVRTQALLAMGMTAQPAAVEPLSAVLADTGRDVEGRIFAAVALGLVANPDAVDVLRGWLAPKRLNKLKNQLRWGLVYAAGVSRSPELVPPLLALADTWQWQHDATMRSLGAVALGQIGSEQTLPALLSLLGDKHNQVRRSAAAGLERAGSHLSAQDVERLIAHERDENDWPARLNLIRALGASDEPAALRHLTDVLQHSTSLVRPHAALALGMRGHPSSAPVLLETLADQHEMSTRGALVLALGLLGSPEARPVLAGMLERASDPAFAGYLALSLGLLGDAGPEVIEALMELASERHDVETVKLATYGLALLGARTRVDRLATELDDGGLGTMDQAARLFALGQVGDARTLGVLLKAAVSDERPTYVVRYAIGALGDLCDPRPVSPVWRLSRHVELNLHVDILFELYRTL